MPKPFFWPHVSRVGTIDSGSRRERDDERPVSAAVGPSTESREASHGCGPNPGRRRESSLHPLILTQTKSVSWILASWSGCQSLSSLKCSLRQPQNSSLTPSFHAPSPSLTRSVQQGCCPPLKGRRPIDLRPDLPAHGSSAEYPDGLHHWLAIATLVPEGLNL